MINKLLLMLGTYLCSAGFCRLAGQCLLSDQTMPSETEHPGMTPSKDCQHTIGTTLFGAIETSGIYEA